MFGIMILVDILAVVGVIRDATKGSVGTTRLVWLRSLKHNTRTVVHLSKIRNSILVFPRKKRREKNCTRAQHDDVTFISMT